METRKITKPLASEVQSSTIFLRGAARCITFAACIMLSLMMGCSMEITQDDVAGGEAFSKDQMAMTLLDPTALLFDGTVKANYTTILMEGGYVPPTARGSNVVPDGSMLRLDLHDDDTNNPDRVRIQAESNSFIDNGEEIWIINEIKLPSGFPTVATSQWLTVASMYGPPFNGEGPCTMQIKNKGAGNVLAWVSNGNMNNGDTYQYMWDSPLLQANVAYTFARRIKVSNNAAVGFMEVWFAPSGTPLVQQLIRNNGVDDAVSRRYFATLDASNNGGANNVRINFYHKPNEAGFNGTLKSLYHGQHKVYDATKCTISEIDPAGGGGGGGSTAFVTGQTLSGTWWNNVNGWLGMKITVGASPITIKELSRWVRSGNTGTHTVKLVTASTGVDVTGGSVSVNTSGATAGQFKYVALASPPTLSANTAYYVVSQETSGADYWYGSGTTLTHTSAAAINNAVQLPNGGSWTAAGTTNNCFVPTGFKYDLAPVTSFVTGQTLSGNEWNDFSGWQGMKITVGASPITIKELGRWVRSGNTGTHTVKLVTASTGVDVTGGSVSVNTSGATAGQFKYVALATPPTLSANTAYYVVSQETNGGDFWFGYGSTLAHTSVATINSAVNLPNGGSWTIAGTTNNCSVPVAFKY